MKNQAFTLIEVLIVILIIGIIASIVVPQYQVVVGKARFSELKVFAKSFQQAVQRYYLINNTYSGITESTNTVLDIKLPAKSNCYIFGGSNTNIRCCKEIFKTNTCLYINRESSLPVGCLVYSTDKSDMPNRLCQKETGTTGGCDFVNKYCFYGYRH